MSPYTRCECTGGDVPHKGTEQHTTTKAGRGVRHHRRCTRNATVKLQRVITTHDELIPVDERMPYHYCAGCAAAIERYQGSQVERVS
jgi:hypothetical protein